MAQARDSQAQLSSASPHAASQQPAQSDIMLKKALIERKLEETGERARLEEYLKQRLVESGWRDDLKRHCLGKCLSWPRAVTPRTRCLGPLPNCF